MAARSRSKRRSSPLADTLLVLISLLLSVFGAELVVRALNGQPLFAFPLPDPVGSASVKPETLPGSPDSGPNRARLLAFVRAYSSTDGK